MIELRELKTALRITNNREDYYLVALEQSAVAYLEQQTSTYYGPPVDVDTLLQGSGTERLGLERPVITVSAVIERIPCKPEPTPVPPANVEGGYLVTPTGLVRLGDIWHTDAVYWVAYRKGWPKLAVPGDVWNAVVQMVSLWYEKRLPVGREDVLPLSAHSVIRSRRRHRA